MPTATETYERLHASLRAYIEATYHVSDPGLIAQRRELLDKIGTIRQRPFLETTPRYVSGRHFAEIGLHPVAADMLVALAQSDNNTKSITHDPPFLHQEEALTAIHLEKKSAVVTTGTGSGKTECFLLPILSNLAQEASESKERFGEQCAMRALILYPMNALVNDQLSRLRLIFGDSRVAERFIDHSGRPARFARYTSRTPYAGVRTSEKDRQRLKALGDFYGRCQAAAEDSDEHRALMTTLQDRGKWPAKPDMTAWYGKKGARWQNPATGEHLRCVTLPEDVELLTRHEIISSPPDVLVTNYSMLEYMLMRPIERPIFDSTRKWLRDNSEQHFILVIDEAHLYRGAAGTEVALLFRRLRKRLGIDRDRLQIICTSASFSDTESARTFAAQLGGINEANLVSIEGHLKLDAGERIGTLTEAEVLAAVDLDQFHSSQDETAMRDAVQVFLDHFGNSKNGNLNSVLNDILEGFGPMNLLRNITMQEAVALDDLSEMLFPGVERRVADQACTALLAMGSLAKPKPDAPPLLPCRVHSFHRGLPGLWICLDPNCTELPPDQPVGVAGKLFSQPRDVCECGARVLELYTCRECGTAYARAYTDNVADPEYLWSCPGEEFRTLSGTAHSMLPLDLLLESPADDTVQVELADLDLVTGRLNPRNLGERTRQVYIPNDQVGRATSEQEDRVGGEFKPCAVCGQRAAYGRSSVQDHQTKGDQPFLALIAEQIRVQQRSKPASEFSPLGGRKVLVFSDSRQVAARLAPNLQNHSTRDILRPLIALGFTHLLRNKDLEGRVSLNELYLAVVLAGRMLGVRLRPSLGLGQSFALKGTLDDMHLGELDSISLDLLMDARTENAPASLLEQITRVLTHKYYGLESLALASLIETRNYTAQLADLPPIPGIAETAEAKLAYCRRWLACWTDPGIWLSQMPAEWWHGRERSQSVRSHSGSFASFDRLLETKEAVKAFRTQWLPDLLRLFTEQVGNERRARGSAISLEFGGAWGYCSACRTTQRQLPGRAICVRCGSDEVQTIDPETDPIFKARKGYYREETVRVLAESPEAPFAIIAAEHTAQLNRAQQDEVFSLAEENELLFQDVDISGIADSQKRSAIDVLSCTTTMEVGIDIGSLTGVSLRNMPPSRANYQQRSGRAGRRGTAVATVTAFGSADSHDEHYFSHPEQMIRGATKDPKLSMNNPEIARRHITAYLLQRYHQVRLPESQEGARAQLFEVLGTVGDFLSDTSILNRSDFQQWLEESDADLKEELTDWLQGIGGEDVDVLLENYKSEVLASIDSALGHSTSQSESTESGSDERDQLAEPQAGELVPELGNYSVVCRPTENLLDRLIFAGALPRYAFPTDVVSFHVFDRVNSTGFRHRFLFAPQQSLPVALSQYVPGREVWISNRLWTSGALYSPFRSDLHDAWSRKMLYFECRECKYAIRIPWDDGVVGSELDCEACGGKGTLGPGQNWMRPPGFAHPIYKEEGTSTDDQPPRSYATRAKLSAPAPSGSEGWRAISKDIRTLSWRKHLLVTNKGPRGQGYSLCIRCGAVSPTSVGASHLVSAHPKPYPDEREPECPGSSCTHGLVLGAEFLSDILLLSLRVSSPLSLQPGMLSTEVVLRTLCVAIASAGTKLLELEPGDVLAEHRPALTAAGKAGLEAEIYLYDTLPGGAGFAHRLWESGEVLLETALELLLQCPENCSDSCYRCLRSYKNRMDHGLLDRHLAASLLKNLLTGSPVVLSEDRTRQSTVLLFEDLRRQASAELALRMEAKVTIPGIGDVAAPILLTNGAGKRFIIGLHSPLATTVPVDPELEPLTQNEFSVPVLLKDELVVRRNLPSVTAELLREVA